MAIGLVMIALAVASATLWRPPETVTASLSADPEAPLLVTDPGVLDLLDEDVVIRATTQDGAPVVLVVGRTQDVTGWVGESAHVRVTGLASWDELAASDPEGEGEAPSPAGSDMWLAEAAGEGEAALEWSADEGRHSLLAATDGTAPAPQLELSWQRAVTTPVLVPGLVAGGVVLLAGAVAMLWAGEDSTRVLAVALALALVVNGLAVAMLVAVAHGRRRNGGP